ncbi:MAG: ABC transporter permease subunit [Streptosporangiaceae bacterium]
MTQTLSRQPAKPANLGNVLSSEWTKIRTVKSTYWTVIATLVVTIGLSFLIALAFTSNFDQLTAEDKAQFDPASYGLIGVTFGQLILAVLGVMVITAEYSTGMIRTALTAVPNRARYFWGKALVLAAVAFVVAEVACFVSFFLAQMLFSAKDISASIGDPGMLRAVFGSGLYLTLTALLSYAIGALLRHTAGAISAALGILFVLPIIGSFLPGEWGDTVAKFLPSNAGGAIGSSRPADGSLEPWTGFAVYALYTAILLAVAFVSFQKRDA